MGWGADILADGCMVLHPSNGRWFREKRVKMGFLGKTESTSGRCALGLGCALLVMGCGSSSKNGSTTGGDGNPAAPGGTNTTTMNGATGGGTGGTGASTLGTGSGSGGASGAAAGGGASGSGSMASSTGGSGGGTMDMNTGGGTAGDSGGAGGSSSSGLDTSGFLTDCQQGGASWGTPQQSGPCISGVTTYGVKQMFGPYGVRSDYNVGKGFETAGTDDSAYCNSVFIPSFGADPKGSADLMDTHDLDFSLYTVFYPGVMPEGEKFPLITWGNGTCAMPEGYGPLLRSIASYGYIIIAANDREVSDGTSMSKGIDFMLSENDKSDSKFYQKIDTDHIGAMGHSQGGGATIMVASNDSRVSAVIIWNAGAPASKPFLAVSGDMDLGAGTDPSSLKNSVTAAQQPGAWIWYHQVPQAVNGSTTGPLAPGHLTLMMESERVIEPALAWWDMMLKGKADAKSMFVGDNCTLCDTSTYPSMWPPFVGLDSPAHEYGANAMLK